MEFNSVEPLRRDGGVKPPYKIGEGPASQRPFRPNPSSRASEGSLFSPALLSNITIHSYFSSRSPLLFIKLRVQWRPFPPDGVP
jgi:hypothetical protein